MRAGRPWVAHYGDRGRGAGSSNSVCSEANMNAPTVGTTYPVLPLRDIVVFPGMIVPLFVGREKSVKALEEVMRDDKHILVVTQKNAQDDDPTPEQIYAT